MAGARLSILLFNTGPAVPQLPAASQTICELVVAPTVSTPFGTFVTKVKLSSSLFASPDSASLAVHDIVTSSACHKPSAPPHVIVGAVLSGGPYPTRCPKT